MSLSASRAATAAMAAMKAAPTGGSEADMKARWEAIFGALFDEIANHATIAPLAGTHALAGPGSHVHALITTLKTEGPIS